MDALKAALFAASALLWSSGAAADPVDRWAVEIEAASFRFGIPQDWIRRVMRAESGGRTDLRGRPIVSSAGAIGLMQVMPGTWRDMRALLRLGSNPHDRADNILAGTAYLRLMYDRFGYPGLFGAYNAGPSRYAAVLAGARPLPAETRSYVAIVARRDIGRASGPKPAGMFVEAAGRQRSITLRIQMAAPSDSLFVRLGSAASP